MLARGPARFGRPICRHRLRPGADRRADVRRPRLLEARTRGRGSALRSRTPGAPGRRAAKRHELYGALKEQTRDSLTFLEEKAVGDATATDYHRRSREFLVWCEKSRLPHRQKKQIDASFCHWMNEAFWEGENPEAGERLQAAATVVRHDIGKGNAYLLRSRQALAGWLKLCPRASRLPVPWAAAAW